MAARSAASPRRSPGLFNSTGALGVLLDPNAPSLGPGLPGCCPANLKPPVPVTNAGQYGYALDTETSPPSLAAAQAHLGHLAASGDPRGWDDAGELTPLRRYRGRCSRGWGLKGLDGTAWYHPLRLTIDAGAVADGNANPAQKRARRARDARRRPAEEPAIYAFGAALGGTRRPRRRQAPRAAVADPAQPPDAGRPPPTYAHNDPALGAPKNDFVKRLVPYLKSVSGS